MHHHCDNRAAVLRLFRIGSAAGLAGERGALLVKAVDFVNDLAAGSPQCHGQGTCDVPTLQFVDDDVDIISTWWSWSGRSRPRLRVFGHDLRWPVKHPAQPGTCLTAPDGFTMCELSFTWPSASGRWRLCEASTVRRMPCKCSSASCCGSSPVTSSTTSTVTSTSWRMGLRNFENMEEFLDLFETVELQTKPSKAQTGQGTHHPGCPGGDPSRRGGAPPTPARIKKIAATVDEALLKDDLAPHVANRLTGRLNVGFGAVGKTPSACVREGARRCSLLIHRLVVRRSGRSWRASSIYTDAFSGRDPP